MRARRRPDLPNLSAAPPFARVGEGQRILSAEGSIISLRPPYLRSAAPAEFVTRPAGEAAGQGGAGGDSGRMA